ncbi:hypothetical protein [Parasitella parasitica]|uniref:Uncharacterized protein n=1 Tax=Parasitella parasitica TaxID=35722 RepID=A0A0B7NWA4_9FUNG|nr:hypothetical protein [Parasitella parasitica]
MDINLHIPTTGSGLLWHRVVNMKLSIFEFPHRFFIRPKPIESMLLFGIIFHLLRTLNTIITLTDAAAPDSVVRESLPFITINVCSIATAVYTQRGNYDMAQKFDDARNYQWMAYWLILTAWLLFAGLRLIKILKQLLHTQLEEGNAIAVDKIKNGLFKVRMIMSTSIFCLLTFSIIRFLYSIVSEYFSQYRKLNLAMSIFLMFDTTVAFTLVVATVIINPKAIGSLHLSPSIAAGLTAFQTTRIRYSSNRNMVPKDDPALIPSNDEIRHDSYMRIV